MGLPLDILIVDDSDRFAEALAGLLADDEGMRTHRAATAAEGLEAARRIRPAVVLMDVVLPDGNGIDVTRRILAELQGSDVIVMTLHDDAAYERRALEAGACAFIPKHRLMPELDEVLARIRRQRS